MAKMRALENNLRQERGMNDLTGTVVEKISWKDGTAKDGEPETEEGGVEEIGDEEI